MNDEIDKSNWCSPSIPTFKCGVVDDVLDACIKYDINNKEQHIQLLKHLHSFEKILVGNTLQLEFELMLNIH